MPRHWLRNTWMSTLVMTSSLFAMTSSGTVNAAPLGSVPPPHTSLETAWQSLITQKSLRNDSVSAYAYDLTTHQVIAAIHPTWRVTPASITKLFTSAAALSTLGPQFTYKTDVMVPASVAHGQPGPIYLVGGGDPWLEANGATGLQTLAATVAKRIPAATSVVGVSSLFKPPVYGMGWPQSGIPYNFSAGTSALMAERSEIFVNVTQGSKEGQTPAVSLQFNSSLRAPGYFHIINHASTGPAKSAWTIHVTRQIGTNNIVVTGNIPLSTSSQPNVSGSVLSVGNPPLFAASLFEQALSQAGVHLSAPASTGSLPSGTVTIATHTSKPLAQYLPIQNQYSINQMADSLYRELGVNATGIGSLSSAAAAMNTFSATAGISSHRVQLDGSGLSPLNEASATQVVNLLTYAASQSWFSTFRDSLMHLNHPHNCGFLCSPYPLPAHTNLWIKTGNLSNQWNYAGYATARNGNLIAFAILDNGSPTNENSTPTSPVTQMMLDVTSYPTVTAPKSGTPSTGTTGTLPKSIKHYVKSLPASGSGMVVGASVTNVATGKVVWQHNGNLLQQSGLLPRVVLGDAALTAGVASPKGTSLAELGTLSHHTLTGALVLNGQADPFLSTSGLQQLANDLQRTGITTVKGPLDYVQAHAGFHSSRWPSSMPWNDIGRGFAAPSSQLWVNGDQATVTIHAGSSGSPASVTVSPKDTPITIQNLTTTSSQVKTASLHLRLTFHSTTYVLSGTVPIGFSESLTISPPNPGQFAAREFEDALKAAGVTVTGSITPVASDPGGTVVGSLNAPSIGNITHALFTNPSLVPAESLVHILGPKLWHDIGAVIPYPNYFIEPTGAALGNYMTANGMSTMLARAWNNPKDAALISSLSHKPWVSVSPEQYDMAGYIKGQRGSVYSVTLIVSQVLWNHHFTPQILPPTTPWR